MIKIVSKILLYLLHILRIVSSEMSKNTSLQKDNFNKSYTDYYVIACKRGIRGASEWNNLCVFAELKPLRTVIFFFPFLPAFYRNVFQEMKMSFVRRLGWLYLSGASDSFALCPKVTACTIKSNVTHFQSDLNPDLTKHQPDAECF